MPKKMIATHANGITIYDLRGGRSAKGAKPGDYVITESGVHRVVGPDSNRDRGLIFYVCDLHSINAEYFMHRIIEDARQQAEIEHDAAHRDVQRTQDDACGRSGY